MTWLLVLLLSWFWAGTPLAQMWPNPGPGRAAAGGGGGTTQLATDAFTRADGGLGANWTTVTGTNAPALVSNGVRDIDVGGNDAAARYSAVTWPNDQYAECSITTASSANVGGGPMVRASTTANTYYRATVKGPFGATAVIRIEKFLAGAYSALTSNITLTLAANDVIRLTVTTSGSNAVLTAYQNGVARAGPVTDSTSALTTGQAGIAVFVDAGALTDVVVDNWAGGSIP